jgi:two-component system sensor histidine kinase/response regulator
MLSDALRTLPLGVSASTLAILVAVAAITALVAGVAQYARGRRRHELEVAELDRELEEVREQAAQARSEKETLMRENQGKSEMVATLSREVRAHLNGIMGSSDLLLDATLSPLQREHLGTLRASAEALHQSLNDILDYSIIEAGKLRIENLPFTLADPLIEVVEQLAPLASLKGLELVLIVSPDVPRYVSGDSARLRQTLLNLMSNSVRFTSTGRVVLHVSLPQGSRAPTQGSSWLHFSVSDTGAGIPESMQTTLFDRFAQSDTPSPRKTGGSGLDLAISKRLVELMGGKIGVRGLPESGAEFWVTLPFGTDRDEVPVVPEPIEDLHVVVLDDLAAARVSISTLLSQLGVEQDAADTVARAEELLRDAHDAGSRNLTLLLDESVAQDHANDLTRVLGGEEAMRAVRVILMTTDPEAAAPIAQRLPVTTLLRKPILRTNLLLKALKTPRRVAVADAPERESPAPAPAPGKPAARPGPLVLVVDDDEISRSVTAQLLERLGCRVERARSGTQAIERTRAVKFDLILMDCQMPDLDGFAATERILAEKPIDAPPIVALTANTTLKDREKCFAAGMCDFVDKPARKAELSRVLKRWTRSGLTPGA